MKTVNNNASTICAKLGVTGQYSTITLFLRGHGGVGRPGFGIW